MTDSARSKALLCAQIALEKKAENVKVLDLTQLPHWTDYFVICSGVSDRQVYAIFESIQKQLRNLNMPPLAHEGTSEGRWILMDFGDVVVHIFLDALRHYYDLESLWSQAPDILPHESIPIHIRKD
jgi:ribosome-associated protein